MKLNYYPTKASEYIKFQVLPIESGILLGGDWLRGNSISLDYQ